jgi:hypothetical protein
MGKTPMPVIQTHDITLYGGTRDYDVVLRPPASALRCAFAAALQNEPTGNNRQISEQYGYSQN